VGFRLEYFKNRGVRMKDFLIKGLKKSLQKKRVKMREIYIQLGVFKQNINRRDLAVVFVAV
jgi:hypothetical protein